MRCEAGKERLRPIAAELPLCQSSRGLHSGQTEAREQPRMAREMNNRLEKFIHKHLPFPKQRLNELTVSATIFTK